MEAGCGGRTLGEVSTGPSLDCNRGSAGAALEGLVVWALPRLCPHSVHVIRPVLLVAGLEFVPSTCTHGENTVLIVTIRVCTVAVG